LKISDIRKQKRNKNRLSIYVDGNYRFSLDEHTLTRAGFHIGDEIDEESISNLTSRDEFFRARDYGFLLLSYRDRSEEEFRKRLLEKSFNREVVEELIDLFKSQNLINDIIFTEKWIEQALHSRPMGALRIRHELRARYIDEHVVDTVLERMLDSEKERDLAHAAVEKKMRALSGYSTDTVKRRLMQHLRNRGFQFDIIHEVMKEYIRDDVG
jgi:regulatory protein